MNDKYMKDPSMYTDVLGLHMEGHMNVGYKRATLYRAWFTAPETTKYRFHHSCDDHCDLYIGDTPGQSAKKTRILDVNHHNYYQRMSWIG